MTLEDIVHSAEDMPQKRLYHLENTLRIQQCLNWIIEFNGKKTGGNNV